MHYGSVKVYCYAISLDVNCIGGGKKTLHLALQFWDIGMSQMTGLAGSTNHELNLRYDGMDEATAFSGNYGDCGDDESKMLSESEKIQAILRAFMQDCGVEVQGEERPAKKQKVDKKAKKPEAGRDEDRKVDMDSLPDVVDAQCMELLEAILGPSGKKVLRQDTYEHEWTLMKIIQKGRLYKRTVRGSTRSFLRSTPAGKEHEMDIVEDEEEYEGYEDDNY